MAKKATAKKKEIIDIFGNTSAAAGAVKKSKSKLGQVRAEAEDVKSAIDEIAELTAQFKATEAALKAAKEKVLEFGNGIHAERMMKGHADNFKILSDRNAVSFIAKNVAPKICEEQLEEMEEAYGEEIRTLYEKDESTVRFNQDFLKDEDNKKKLLAALSPLGADFLSQMFTPVQYKPVGDIKNVAVKIVDKPEDLLSLYDEIGLSRFVQK